MSGDSSNAGLLAQVEELKARLAEAEDVLNAIRNGEVDAVVVQGTLGEQIYTLSGTGLVYRHLIESMSEGAVTLSRDGIILYCNRYLAVMLGRPLEQVLGSPLRSYVHPDDAASYDKVFTQAYAAPSSTELSLVSTDNHVIPARLSAARFLEGSSETIFCIVATDLTEQKKRLDQVAAAERLARSILDQTADAIIVCDADGIVIRASAAAIMLCGHDPTLRHVEEVFSFQTEDGKRLLPLTAPESKSLRNLDISMECRGKRRDLILNVGPLVYDVTKSGHVITLTDITERKRAEMMASRLAAIVESSTDAIIGRDLESKVTSWNKGAEDLFGFSAGEMRGASILRTIPPGREHEERDLILQIANGVTVPPFDTQRMTKDGRTVEISLRASPIKNSAGKVVGVASVARDITDRKQTEKRIRYLNRVYAVLSGVNMLIVHERDTKKLFKGACRIATEVGGFRMALLCTLDPTSRGLTLAASSGKDRGFVANVRRQLAMPDNSISAFMLRTLDEKHALVENYEEQDAHSSAMSSKQRMPPGSMAALPLIVDGQVVGIITLFAGEEHFFQKEEMSLLNDLAGNIAFAIDYIGKEKKLHYLAFYDGLTGLANRHLFLDRAAQQLRGIASSSRKLAFFLIDLERFRNINESLGRTIGDNVLKQVARWLVTHFKDETLVARLGADQFAALLPGIEQGSDAARFAEHMLDDFARHPFQEAESALRLVAKLGVALSPDDATEADILLRNAEAALKKAKAGGDRYLFYTQRMTEEVALKLALENQLQQAFKNKEFVIFYQPKVNSTTAEVLGAEALIRWNRPGVGIVSPITFIGILEETGLIHEIGLWILHEALRHSESWHARGLLRVPVAVNFSPIQFRHPSFLNSFLKEIESLPGIADWVEVEITESTLVEGSENNIHTLAVMRDMGIFVSIDDFGTGFSGLSYLIKLPVDGLKIDRSFITHMSQSPNNLALVSTIIDLAHALNLKVVAEGVETEEQAKLLRLLRCDEIQGFYISEPMPLAQFEEKYLKSTRPRSR